MYLILNVYTSSNRICVSTFIFGCLPVPQTGEHPNMNVETQIPLELCLYMYLDGYIN